MQNCGNCCYKDISIKEEPCKECIYGINWEAEDQEEEKDV